MLTKPVDTILSLTSIIVGSKSLAFFAMAAIEALQRTFTDPVESFQLIMGPKLTQIEEPRYSNRPGSEFWDPGACVEDQDSCGVERR